MNPRIKKLIIWSIIAAGFITLTYFRAYDIKTTAFVTIVSIALIIYFYRKKDEPDKFIIEDKPGLTEDRVREIVREEINHANSGGKTE